MSDRVQRWLSSGLLANWGRFRPGSRVFRLGGALGLAAPRLPGVLEHLLEHRAHVVGVDELDSAQDVLTTDLGDIGLVAVGQEDPA